MSELIHKILQDRYEIIRKFDEGGTSDIYIVRDQETEETLALKMLKKEFASDEQYVEAFLNEIHILRKMKFPGIVHLVDDGEYEDTYWYVMEYIDGPTLKKLMRRGDLTLEQKVETAQIMTRTMGLAHLAGVVHGDIKPENVVLDQDMYPVILDFGTADDNRISKSVKDKVIGTVEYFSPEQAKGEKPDKSSDIYSMGVLLYELFTGNLPFTGKDKVKLALKHVHQLPYEPSKIADVPESISRIILKAMRKDKKDRYQSFGRMEEDLKRCLEDPSGEYITDYLDTYVPEEPAEEETDNKNGVGSNRRLRHIIYVILAAAFLIIGFIVAKNVLNGLDTKDTEKIMPSFVGKPYSEALLFAEDNGIIITYEFETNQEIGADMVISQIPESGSPIKEGEEIRLKVSLGKGEADTMPDLSGMNIDDAIQLLNEMGISDIGHEYVHDHSYPEDTVIRSEPAAGEPIRDTVYLFVAEQGGSDISQVPNVTGMDLGRAVSELRAAGFRHVYINIMEGGDVKQDTMTVESQYPSPEMTDISFSYVEINVNQPKKPLNVKCSTPEITLKENEKGYITWVLEVIKDGETYEFILERAAFTEGDLEEETRSFTVKLVESFKGSEGSVKVYSNETEVYRGIVEIK